MELLVGSPFLVLGIQWGLLDARQRNRRIGNVMRICLIALFVLAFPIYVLMSRGIFGVKTLVLAMLFVAALFTILYVSGYITIQIGLMAGLWT